MKYIYILLKKKSYDLFLKIFFIIYYLLFNSIYWIFEKGYFNYLKMVN